MTINLSQYHNNVKASPDHQYTTYGPFWQSECDWCCAMSDCFDSAEEAQAWTTEHRCSVIFTVGDPRAEA